MQSNLYEALGVAPSSDTPALRAALRAVLRRFWVSPRDASGDSEEAVRFVALGAAILTDDARRSQYDGHALPSQSQNPWRAMSAPPLAEDAAISLGLDASAAHSVQQSRHAEASVLPTVSALARSLPEATNWASAYVFAATAAALVLLAAIVIWVVGEHASLAVSALLVGLAIALAYAIGWRIHSEAPDNSAPSLSRLSIVKWRRESSIFMGNPPPQQDTAWIFRLRLMELTRSAAGFTTLQNLGGRILARCADYAILALMALATLSALQWFFPSASLLISIIRSPLCFPTLVVLLGIAWETLWLSRSRATPGRWLLGAVVVSGVTQTSYSDVSPSASVVARRSWHHAMSAMALGVVPVALWRARDRWTQLKHTEGSWEAASDSVVLTRPTALPLRAAAAALSIGAIVLLSNFWVQDAASVKTWLSQNVWGDVSRRVGDLASGPKTVRPNSGASDPASTPSGDAPVAAAGESTKPALTSAPASPVAAAATPDPRIYVAPAKPSPVDAPPSAAAKQPSAPAVTASDAQSQAVQARRARIDAVTAQAARARQSGNYAGLQGACQRWTDDQPGNAQAWRCLGLAKFQAGAGRDALPALRQALKLEPNDSEVESAILRTLRP
ncbi:MAG: hypothetical protein EAZ30_09250 [Betaproteobacteria bacterium]|nr:MAG: hypothetical protein EAZ30_09250 [Betaproteobacteria bacterium]